MKAKNGISLIVLVITIVVIIILAAAVILSLGDNNPINNSRIASLTQTRDNLESATTMYLSTAFTKTLGEYDAKAILTATGIDAKYGTFTAVLDTTEANIKTIDSVDYYPVVVADAKTVLDIDLSKEAGTWYLAPSTGKALVAYDTIPAYLMDGESLSTSVAGFVATK